MTDINFVLGYIFYLLAINPKTLKAEKDLFLKEALKLNSIHAAQEELHGLLQQEALDPNTKEEKIAAIACFLEKQTEPAAKHGTPGYLLLANGYLHVVNLTLAQQPHMDTKQYETACLYLWKYLTLAEETEEQSTASINNAYFGAGLRLSNPLLLSSIEEIKTQTASRLIADTSIKLRAEKSAREEFGDKADFAHLIAWRNAKERRIQSMTVKPAPEDTNPSP